MSLEQEKLKCYDCGGKGYYTQMFGKNYYPDFIGDKFYQEKSTIHKIACPKCNWKNKRRLKNVLASIHYA